MMRDSHSAFPSAGGQRTQITRRTVSIAGFRDPAEVAAVLKQDGPKDLSTFYGIHVLNALAKSGDIDTGPDFISRYSGGMLDFGAHCYVGFRSSFFHGGAGGPTAWLNRNVLGISPSVPGFAKARIAPNVGHLTWAEGTFPMPKGPIHVRHQKLADVSIQSTVKLPEGVTRE